MLSFLTRFTAKPLPERIALFPLTATLFPGGRLGLKVFEQRYLELAKARIADNELFGIVTLTGGGEVGGNQAFANIGTAARIQSYDVPQAGIFLLDVIGEDRFEVLKSSVDSNGLHQAKVRWIRNEPKVKLGANYSELATTLAQVIEKTGVERFAEPFALDDSSWVGSRLVEILQLPPSIKQSLLEINDAELRLKTVKQLLSRVAGNSAARPS